MEPGIWPLGVGSFNLPGEFSRGIWGTKKVKLATAYFRTNYIALSLALPPFTSVFGMGTGGSTAHCCQNCAAAFLVWRGKPETQPWQPFKERETSSLVPAHEKRSRFGCGRKRTFVLLREQVIQAFVGLVPVSSIHCCIYTFGLSTWWSPTPTIEKQS